jgi:hypothetical protein
LAFSEIGQRIADVLYQCRVIKRTHDFSSFLDKSQQAN